MGANETLLQCPKCGTKTKDPLCPKCGHSFVSGGTTIKAALGGLVAGATCIMGHDWFGCKCKRCGKVRDEQHTFQPIEGKCQEKCSVCGKIKDLPHQWRGSLWQGRECARCGFTEKPAYTRGAFWGIVGAVLFVLLISIAIAAGTASEKASESAFESANELVAGIKMPGSSTDFKFSNYEDVVMQLQTAGFTNIKTVALKDIILGWLTKDGEVERVSVNGETEFKKGAKFDADAKIVVTYHTFPETSEEATPAAAEEASITTAPAKNNTADWKQFLKSYEAWVDSYNVIIKKLNNGDLTVLADYLILADKMTEWEESADEWEDEMSAADYAEFYPEYMRITAKMLVALDALD